MLACFQEGMLYGRKHASATCMQLTVRAPNAEPGASTRATLRFVELCAARDERAAIPAGGTQGAWWVYTRTPRGPSKGLSHNAIQALEQALEVQLQGAASSEAYCGSSLADLLRPCAEGLQDMAYVLCARLEDTYAPTLRATLRLPRLLQQLRAMRAQHDKEGEEDSVQFPVGSLVPAGSEEPSPLPVDQTARILQLEEQLGVLRARLAHSEERCGGPPKRTPELPANALARSPSQFKLLGAPTPKAAETKAGEEFGRSTQSLTPPAFSTWSLTPPVLSPSPSAANSVAPGSPLGSMPAAVAVAMGALSRDAECGTPKPNGRTMEAKDGIRSVLPLALPTFSARKPDPSVELSPLPNVGGAPRLCAGDENVAPPVNGSDVSARVSLAKEKARAAVQSGLEQLQVRASAAGVWNASFGPRLSVSTEQSERELRDIAACIEGRGPEVFDHLKPTEKNIESLQEFRRKSDAAQPTSGALRNAPASQRHKGKKLNSKRGTSRGRSGSPVLGSSHTQSTPSILLAAPVHEDVSAAAIAPVLTPSAARESPSGERQRDTRRLPGRNRPGVRSVPAISPMRHIIPPIPMAKIADANQSDVAAGANGGSPPAGGASKRRSARSSRETTPSEPLNSSQRTQYRRWLVPTPREEAPRAACRGSSGGPKATVQDVRAPVTRRAQSPSYCPALTAPTRRARSPEESQRPALAAPAAAAAALAGTLPAQRGRAVLRTGSVAAPARSPGTVKSPQLRPRSPPCIDVKPARLPAPAPPHVGVMRQCASAARLSPQGAPRAPASAAAAAAAQSAAVAVAAVQQAQVAAAAAVAAAGHARAHTPPAWTWAPAQGPPQRHRAS